jgi:ferrous iron transport protein B
MHAESSSGQPKSSQAGAAGIRTLALAGNPNSGKTSLFNRLTGLRHRIGNYPGVTVERVEGNISMPGGESVRVVDLPGCYSLFSQAPDEAIARDALLGLIPDEEQPDAVLVVVDASNLERNLYFVTQLLETGLPVCVALNMIDVAERQGHPVDAAALEEELGVPVVPVIARTGENVDALRTAIGRARVGGRIWRMPQVGEEALMNVYEAVHAAGVVPQTSEEGEAIRLLCHARDHDPFLERGGEPLQNALAAARAKLVEAGIDREAMESEFRYALCKRVTEHARAETGTGGDRSEAIDRIVTHRVLGPIIYVAVMALIFQAVYAWAVPFMDTIDAAVAWTGDGISNLLGEGMLTDLLVDGVLAGVGGIIIFLPQICLLFFFLTLLEDLGYLSRAAFLADRVMRGVGLHGKAFIPLMSSFACAIPGIMATRSMDNRRDRIVTMLVAPLISCSARLPVYALLIAAFIPQGYQGLCLLSMYLLSVAAALAAAFVLRKTVVKGEPSTFMMELPSYKLPAWRHVLRTVANRGWVFVRQAGTVILAISIILWFLATFPKSEEVEQQAAARIEAGEDTQTVKDWESSEQIRNSYAGKMGLLMEPAIEPLGFDWRIGVGLVTSFAAREVLVSTLGIVFSVGEADETSVALRDRLRNARRPNGTKAYDGLVAVSLMVFFVLACQCMATLAVIKRETNSWRWPLFVFGYMTVLAWVASFVVYQGGLALGFGT